MGQTASIAAKTSWPHLFAPVLGATIARFVVPGKNVMLWGAAIGFVLSFFTGVATNSVAQRQQCQKSEMRYAIPAALSPALMTAVTFITMHFLLTNVVKKMEDPTT